MKQKIYTLGIITTLIIFTGATLKINHWPGASILLTLGLVTMVWVFLPLAIINNYKADRIKANLSLYIVTYITCVVVFTAMLFKIQHWPYAGIFLTIALPFPYVVFLPVFLSVTSKNKNFNIYNVVFVLSLLALNSVFSVLLALNVSKSRVEDSYRLSRNYNQIEKALGQLPEANPKSTVSLKIDEAIKIVNDYQDIILKKEGTSREQWETNAGNLNRPEAPAVAGQSLEAAGESPVGIKLETALKNLVTAMENTKGYERLAKSAPVIFHFNNLGEVNSDFTYRNFIDINLAWALTYLDGLEANLLLIKACAPIVR
ncbi:MAG TPA: hypothetical protein VIK07_10520 [Bacteroidales bacterium]